MSELEIRQMLSEYRRIIAQSYPAGKKRGDGDPCMDSRQKLFARLSAMDCHSLSLRQIEICALAYDACVLSQKSSEVLGFQYDAIPQMLHRIFAICKSDEIVRNVLNLLGDLESMGTFGRQGFLSATEKPRWTTVDDRTSRPAEIDEFERAQIVDESGSEIFGLDEESHQDEE